MLNVMLKINVIAFNSTCIYVAKKQNAYAQVSE